MVPVLVTGGAGYIGAHTCKALDAAGYRPIVYDNLVTGHRAAVRWGPFEYGDILDRSRLDEVIARHAPQAILHFAAFAQVGESVVDPGKYYRNNVAGSLTLLQAMRAHGLRRIIFSSSCAIYGTPRSLPLTESAPLDPINPYGRSKLMVEQMLADYATSDDLRWVALRYFNAAGADPDGEIGEDHDPETRIVPLAIAAAGRSHAPLTLYGTDYDTPDGTCVRDYVHVSDLADAHVAALQASERGLASGPFNLGAGRGVSIREVIATIEEVTGLPVAVREGPRRMGDPAILFADAGKAQEMLRWFPRRSDLRNIVGSAWRWHQAQSRRLRH
jgi:UDP-arabinose 4-epimerase